MADPLSSLIRPNPGPQLPAFERFAPPPPENVVLAELAARTAPGDVVIDLHGRGGWVARSAIGALRRIYACESSALTRLLAEVVLRPPDLRHFDAAIAALAVQPRGDVELRRSLDQPFTSRCPTCGRPVVVDEFIWETDASGARNLTRKAYRCSFCREQTRGTELRVAPVDDDDVQLARDMDERPAAWATLRARLPVPAADHVLADEVLAIYTPRTLVALEAIIGRLETDLRAAPLDAALRLGVVHALLPLSRLNSYPGRVGALRIRHGHVQQPAGKAWRERNPWLAFEQGWRDIRDFVSGLEAGTASFQPRPGDDMEALIDGTANVVLRTGSPALAGNEPRFSSSRPVLPGRLDPRSRVRLVLTQPPPRGTIENVSFAYLATAFLLGRHAAAALTLERIFGPVGRNDRGREATALRRSLLAVRPVLARDASAVVFLDRGGVSGLVAGVLGGVGAGFRLNSALLAEAGDQVGGLLEFNLGQPADEPDTHPELAELPHALPGQPFSLTDVEKAVSQVAVSVLQARGEPATAERLLGEVLIGLDRLGHLRRLVAPQTFTETEAATESAAANNGSGPTSPAGEATAAPSAEAEADEEQASAEPATSEAASEATSAESPPPEPDGAEAQEEPPDWAVGVASATDHVKLLMEIVMGELRRPDHPRLLELEPGRWWLRSDRDLAEARPPLADRLEWAVFGLLSTAQQLEEGTFYERVARMFAGHDTPDPELVRAVLDSYRDPAAARVALRPQDELAARHVEHGDLVGVLVEYGHRLGLRCHVSPKERRRGYRGRTVDDLLTEDEQRASVPLIAAGDVQTLESIDCIWYLRGKATFLFEVEWTAMLTDALLKRGPRIPGNETLVRFLVIPPERSELVRLKIARSPLLRRALDEQNWHILKSDHLRQLHSREDADLDQLAPMLGLDPEIERQAEQLALFG